MTVPDAHSADYIALLRRAHNMLTLVINDVGVDLADIEELAVDIEQALLIDGQKTQDFIGDFERNQIDDGADNG